MKRLILAILLLFSSFSATQSWASGSNTVFFPVRSREYSLAVVVPENIGNPKLQSYIERVETRVYVASVSHLVWHASAHLALQGYSVRLGFEGLESITFNYYANVNALIGFTSYNNPVILYSAY